MENIADIVDVLSGDDGTSSTDIPHQLRVFGDLNVGEACYDLQTEEVGYFTYALCVLGVGMFVLYAYNCLCY